MSVNAQPNNTASSVESFAVVPDAGVEKSVVAEVSPCVLGEAIFAEEVLLSWSVGLMTRFRLIQLPHQLPQNQE